MKQSQTLASLQGLTDAEVSASRQKHGANTLTPPKRASLLSLYLDKFKDPIIKILLVAACFSFILAFIEDDFAETIGIFLAIFFATSVGFYFERDAAKKFSVLNSLDEESLVKVMRNGAVCQIQRCDVVVGDIVLLETGDEVPADGELIKANGLQIDESSLTGEPIINKHVEDELQDSEATYPSKMVLRGTMVMNGRGVARITVVGDATEIGKVARKSTEMTTVKTPLNMQLTRLAKLISKIGTSVAVATFLIFSVHDIYKFSLGNPAWDTKDIFFIINVILNYFMMSVTLIVMAVPEGLPMTVTLSLALNMRRMLKSNNLVRKLHACETMGAVTVICTDKTGTLTQNRMQVAEMVCESDEKMLFNDSLALNTTAHLDQNEDGKGIGNPTEVALLLWLKAQGVNYRELREKGEIIDQLPFSTERKYMATIICTDVISEGTMRWQGMAAISDPLREDVPGAVAECRSAGIKVKIVTGDTSATAIEIARQIGIWDENTSEECIITGTDFAALSDEDAYNRVEGLKVMSRARPADKQRLVELLQKHEEVVAVTGDGTNDAPALNHAQVGLTLGSSTSVAKEASDMTLLDDSFNSIVKAVMWGRSLYKNIQRFIFFQLIVNVTALLLVLVGAFIGTELPLTVTQILWVNLIMDTFAAMALASLPPSHEVMTDNPRSPDDFIITRSMAKSIAFIGLAFFVILLVMLINYEKKDMNVHELTIFFTTFVMLQFWNLFNAKTLGSIHSAFRHFKRDNGLILVLIIVFIGQWLIVEFGDGMFRTEHLSLKEWAMITSSTSFVLWIGELWRGIKRLKANKKKGI